MYVPQLYIFIIIMMTLHVIFTKEHVFAKGGMYPAIQQSFFRDVILLTFSGFLDF